MYFSGLRSVGALVLSLSVFTTAVVSTPIEAGAATVRTPFGDRLRANVHTVPTGGQIVHVGGEIHLVNAAGAVVHIAQNDRTKVRATPIADSKPPQQTGWVAYAYWYNTHSSPISSFATNWDVPDKPSSNHGQTIFLFNSIEPASGDAIIQPVLQYGPSAAGGGTYWAVASWYLVGSHVYISKLVKVSSGDSLNGLITLKSHSGDNYNYVASFKDIDDTDITATGSDELVWATETLESYGTTKESDYPPGKTIFRHIKIKTSSDSTPSVTWTAVSDKDDSLNTSVNTQGSSDAKITITY